MVCFEEEVRLVLSWAVMVDQRDRTTIARQPHVKNQDETTVCEWGGWQLSYDDPCRDKCAYYCNTYYLGSRQVGSSDGGQGSRWIRTLRHQETTEARQPSYVKAGRLVWGHDFSSPRMTHDTKWNVPDRNYCHLLSINFTVSEPGLALHSALSHRCSKIGSLSKDMSHLCIHNGSCICSWEII